MIVHFLARPISCVLLALAVAGGAAEAAPLPEARLVHCGRDTCLRIAGYRASASVAVGIAGRDLAVEGGRRWRATVPLAAARRGVDAAGGSLALTMTDARTGAGSVQPVALPPGALGRPVELASLIVRAR